MKKFLTLLLVLLLLVPMTALAQTSFDDACSLLKTTSKSIGEIAELLSFHDQAAFSNFFKQHSGMSPLAFRK